MHRHANIPTRYELHPQLAADTHPLATFALCDLRLMDDANYPWLILVPQLHVHVIARFEHDPSWPAPVWGRVAARPYTPEGLVERISQLRDALLT